MSNKAFARRTAIQVYIKGKDVSKEVSKYLLSMSYTDKEGGETDDLSISLDDREGRWLKKWLKMGNGKKCLKGVKIRAKVTQKNFLTNGKDKVLNCGTFEVDSVDFSGPPQKVDIKATSIPYKSKLRQTRRYKTWEKTTLKNIASKIAAESGLKLMYLSDYNPKYHRREQKDMTNIAFLQRLCKKAGINLKVTSNKLVLYDAEKYEAKNEVKKIKAGKSNILSYSFTTKTADASYSACHVKYTDPHTKKKIEATYKPENANEDGQTLEVKQKVTSKAEAMQLAKKLLREKNKDETTAQFTLMGDVDYVAGITVRVYGFGDFSGKYIVQEATHDVTGGYSTQIKLRHCLRGY